jgi:hypothetical protein
VGRFYKYDSSSILTIKSIVNGCLKLNINKENIMKSSILNCVSIACVVFGIAGTANAESFRTVSADDGTVYQIDLDTRTEYTTDAGWRHVQFWLSTKGDPNKHRSTASCQPYQVQSEFYNFNWLPDGGGYPAGSVGGEIARVACS